LAGPATKFHPSSAVAPRAKPRNRTRGRRRRQQGLAAFFPEAAHYFFHDPEGPALKTAKFLVGLLLLPLCWVLFETFVVLLKADTLAGDYWKSREFLFFGLGGTLWLVLYFFLRCRAMMWLYVAGHELTHALFVLIFRGKVTKLHISHQGGHILTNRTNFLISLSPYFFPFYSVAMILAWSAFTWVVAEHAHPDPVWLYGAIGLTWMFHLTFTLRMIRGEQPDLDQNGRLFSLTVIFAANVLLLSAMLIVASPSASFRGFFASLWQNLLTFTPRLVESVREVYSFLGV
jgi:hypothetical protein